MKGIDRSPLERKPNLDKRKIEYPTVAVGNMQERIEKNKKDLEGLKKAIEDLSERIVLNKASLDRRLGLRDSAQIRSSLTKNEQLRDSLIAKANSLIEEIRTESESLAGLQIEIDQARRDIFTDKKGPS